MDDSMEGLRFGVDIVARTALRFGVPVGTVRIFQRLHPELFDKLYQEFVLHPNGLSLAGATAIGGIVTSLVVTACKNPEISSEIPKETDVKGSQYNLIERAESKIIKQILHPQSIPCVMHKLVENIKDNMHGLKKSHLAVKTDKKLLKDINHIKEQEYNQVK